jgi:hypothetical protein
MSRTVSSKSFRNSISRTGLYSYAKTAFQTYARQLMMSVPVAGVAAAVLVIASVLSDRVEPLAWLSGGQAQNAAIVTILFLIATLVHHMYILLRKEAASEFRRDTLHLGVEWIMTVLGIRVVVDEILVRFLAFPGLALAIGGAHRFVAGLSGSVPSDGPLPGLPDATGFAVWMAGAFLLASRIVIYKRMTKDEFGSLDDQKESRRQWAIAHVWFALVELASFAAWVWLGIFGGLLVQATYWLGLGFVLYYNENRYVAARKREKAEASSE